MRHLKSYKIFESSNRKRIKETCEDILLELTDYGYDYKITINDWDDTLFLKMQSSNLTDEDVNWISIKVIKKCTDEVDIKSNKFHSFSLDLNFYWEEVKDVFERLSDYLSSEGLEKFQSKRFTKVPGTTSTYSMYITFSEKSTLKRQQDILTRLLESETISKKHINESTFNGDIVDDVNDIFLDLTDNPDIKIEFKSITENTLYMKFRYIEGTPGPGLITDFLNSDEFKRAYYYIKEKGFTKYYINITDSAQEVINSPSSSLANDEPWLAFKHIPSLNLKRYDKVVTMEFHRPLDTWHTIWVGAEAEWDKVSKGDGVSREEAILLLNSTRAKYGEGGPAGRYYIISDEKYWDKQR